MTPALSPTEFSAHLMNGTHLGFDAAHFSLPADGSFAGAELDFIATPYSDLAATIVTATTAYGERSHYLGQEFANAPNMKRLYGYETLLSTPNTDRYIVKVHDGCSTGGVAADKVGTAADDLENEKRWPTPIYETQKSIRHFPALPNEEGQIHIATSAQCQTADIKYSLVMHNDGVSIFSADICYDRKETTRDLLNQFLPDEVALARQKLNRHVRITGWETETVSDMIVLGMLYCALGDDDFGDTVILDYWDFDSHHLYALKYKNGSLEMYEFDEDTDEVRQKVARHDVVSINVDSDYKPTITVKSLNVLGARSPVFLLARSLNGADHPIGEKNQTLHMELNLDNAQSRYSIGWGTLAKKIIPLFKRAETEVAKATNLSSD